MKNFYQVLVNTLLANVTTNFLWFALIFWIYLETKSVLANGILGGLYFVLVSIFSMQFGTIVDKNKKHSVMAFASVFTLVMFGIGGIIYFLSLTNSKLSVTNPMLWLFASTLLIGAIVENMRNIALSTTVTLLVPKDKRANANGLVGTVQGVSFIITSIFSGLSVGLLGMNWTMVIALVLTAISAIHIFFVKIPEDNIYHDSELVNKKIDIRGSIAAVTAIPGLFALLIFSTFNNLIGGVYMALLDPYGLTVFSVEIWGIVYGLTGTGFIIGGLLIGKFGLGKQPVKTLLTACIVMGILGGVLTLREWPALFIIGAWLYTILVPVLEATEQTIIQRVVPYERQGRVFGFAQAFESAAAPVTSFLVAPLAEFLVIPYMNSEAGQAQLGWLLGPGQARGIALVFLIAGIIITTASALAFKTKSYGYLSKSYAKS
ncbi:MAG: MFS transporter [Micrococcaceae bacterium]